MPEKIKLALLWHMHQPYYKDPLTGSFEMPWVRLHALKDYWGMVAMLEEFPKARMTFNLVPSLLSQINDFLAQPESDPFFTLAFLPVDRLTDDQKLLMQENFFQANYDHQILRFPRYLELYQRAQGAATSKEGFKILHFASQELLDLQVLAQLCWFDEIYLEKDREIHWLVEKGRGFTEEDKAQLRGKELEVLSRIIPCYRESADQGQIEISTSPFFHPILPLLCDSSVALQSQPQLPHPSRAFQYPEDAAFQLKTAIDYHQRLFGRRPFGVWPSEGSVSNTALDCIAAEGFRWAATDQGILERSLGITFHRTPRGYLNHAGELYSPWRYKNTDLHVFFRDREISDAIGFVYSRMPLEDAVHHFLDRIKSSVANLNGTDAAIPIILDGENAWEYFPCNGRPFLREFYRRLTEDAQIEMVTFSELLLSLHSDERRLESIWPGSWIDSDFHIWIGDSEDNRAWELLLEARETFDRFLRMNPGSKNDPRVIGARESLMAAEGSDWCWWYGPENSSANDLRFDRLFRAHLINAYQQLGQSVPPALAQPLKRHLPKQVHILPTGRIHPIIDGQASGYFEWLGAGSIFESGTTMHPGKRYFEKVFYGWDEGNVYLRLDPAASFLSSSDKLDLKISLDSKRILKVSNACSKHSGIFLVVSSETQEVEQPIEKEKAESAFSKLLEVRIQKSLWRLRGDEPLTFSVLLEVNGVPVERFPVHGSFSIDDAVFE